MSNGVKSWSYSAYSLYEQCPAKYKYAKLDKLPEPRSDALTRGDETHKKIAHYLVTKDASLPAEAKKFGDQMAQLKGLNPFVEQQWGYTREWKESSWRDWTNTWFRATLDAGVIYPDNTADVIDHKTGKLYGTNEDQIELFSLSVMMRYREVRHVTARLWYLDSGDEVVRDYPATEKTRIKAKWEEKVGPMFADQTFAPRPNKWCGSCHFRKSNGGPCRFA